MPRFNRNRMPEIRNTLASLHISFDNEASRKLIQHPRLNPALLDVLTDVISATTLFNDLTSTRKIDLYLYQEVLVSIFYRLLSIPFHADTSRAPTVEDAYHIGLTLFLMSLFLQHGRNRIIDYGKLVAKWDSVLRSPSMEQEEGLAFWLLMVGGFWVVDDDDAEWLLPMIRDQANRMNCKTWEAVKDTVRRYPWIGPIHDKLGIYIWTKAMAL